MLTKLKKTFKRPKSGCLQVHPKMYALWHDTEGNRQICYLWIGNFGNIVIGLNEITTQLKNTITALGGVKYVLPRKISEHSALQAVEWFKVFGCQFIYTGQHPDWNVLWLHLDHLLQVDKLKISSLARSSEQCLEWKVSLAENSYYSRKSPDQSDEATTRSYLMHFLGKRTMSSDHFIEACISSQSLADASSQTISTLLEHRILAYRSIQFPMIAIFDDIEFERSDIDLVPPKARQTIIKALKKSSDFDIASNYINCLGHAVKFSAPPRSISTPLSDMLQTEPNTILIVTPTQLAAHLCDQLQSSNQLEEELTLLIKQLPINLRKLKSQYPSICGMIERLSHQQKYTIRFFREHRPKGILGQLPENREIN